MLNGIDVSQWQGVMDWNKAKAAGVQFAFIRCTFGFSVDNQFKANWAGAKAAGIPRGAYGWCLDGYNQVSLATHFWNQIKDDPGELPPIVDFEKYGSTWVGFSALQQNIETVESLSKKVPMIYSSYGYWSSLKNYSTQYWATKYPYWHAQYTSAATPKIPAPFDKWTFWQWSADGNGKGATYGAKSSAIDLNRFNGDAIDFAVFMGAEVIEPDPQEPPPSDYIDRLTKLETWARGIGYKG